MDIILSSVYPPLPVSQMALFHDGSLEIDPCQTLRPTYFSLCLIKHFTSSHFIAWRLIQSPEEPEETSGSDYPSELIEAGLFALIAQM